MRIVTKALARAAEDKEKKGHYPRSYRGTLIAEDDTHMWLSVGVARNSTRRRMIAIPKSSIIKVTKA